MPHYNRFESGRTYCAWFLTAVHALTNDGTAYATSSQIGVVPSVRQQLHDDLIRTIVFLGQALDKEAVTKRP
ncbi:hypothetical protein GCM10022380_81000 [Amycolatopsis tucumanensis]|uniref:Uncharacterized protein n=1 Tax=Amycolatopsis tucumanensis TaxID=401106 RepID=A0ABP7JPM8_9PSEU